MNAIIWLIRFCKLGAWTAAYTHWSRFLSSTEGRGGYVIEYLKLKFKFFNPETNISLHAVSNCVSVQLSLCAGAGERPYGADVYCRSVHPKRTLRIKIRCDLELKPISYCISTKVLSVFHRCSCNSDASLGLMAWHCKLQSSDIVVLYVNT